MDLFGLFALMAGHRAGQRIQQHVLGVLTHALREVLVFEPGDEGGECLGGFLGLRSGHCSLPVGRRSKVAATVYRCVAFRALASLPVAAHKGVA